MNANRHRRGFGHPVAYRHGAILVLMAALVPVLAIMAAFAIDVAWMQMVRAELRTATDAAARAAAKQLSLEQDTARATAAAIDAASRNLVAGKPLQLAAGDVIFGSSTQANANSRFTFTQNGNPTNAVRVTGSRANGSAGGPVSLFFGGVLGVKEFEPSHVAISTVLDRDISLVLDRSGSMEGQKIEDLKVAVGAFIDELRSTFPDEQVALTSYSSTARLDNGLTKDFLEILAKQQDFTAEGRTAIGLALQEGIQAVQGAGSRKFAVPTIVLMTDGIHNTGEEPIIPAKLAASLGITVHTVTFGSDADIDRMVNVASVTGGRHFHADDGAGLQDVFREIARTLPVILTE